MNKDKNKKSIFYSALMYIFIFFIPVAFYASVREGESNLKKEIDLKIVNEKLVNGEDVESATKGDRSTLNSASSQLKSMLSADASYEEIQQGVLGWLEEDESAALAYLEEGTLVYYLLDRGFEETALGNVVGEYLFSKYGGEKSVAVLEAYEYLSPIIQKTYERIIEQWVVEDQDSLKDWWYDSPMVNYHATIERLIQAQFLHNDPVKAIKFHEDLPEEDGRKELSMTRAYIAFVDHHEDVAIRHLEDLEPTPYANNAHQRLAVNSYSNNDVAIEQAMSWVDRIEDNDDLKYQTMGDSLSYFSIDRPEEYKRWLEETSYFENNNIPRDEAIEFIQMFSELRSEDRKFQAEQAGDPDSPYYISQGEEEATSENL